MSRKTEGIIIILVVLFIAPVIQMVLMSFKQPLDLFSTFLFFKPTGANYVDLFSRLNLTYFFKNSIIISSGTAVLTVILGAVDADSFARYNFPMRKFLLFMVLFSRMLPPVAGVVPLFSHEEIGFQIPMEGSFFYILLFNPLCYLDDGAFSVHSERTGRSSSYRWMFATDCFLRSLFLSVGQV